MPRPPPGQHGCEMRAFRGEPCWHGRWEACWRVGYSPSRKGDRKGLTRTRVVRTKNRGELNASVVKCLHVYKGPNGPFSSSALFGRR
eukprot:8604081-Pyramimonas_sp.AAC.1